MGSTRDKYYKPWSFIWIIQRIILIIKEHRFRKISFKTLWIDYKLTIKIRKELKANTNPGKLSNDPAQLNTINQSIEDKYELSPLMTCESLQKENLSLLNSYFDHIYVVNLERRTDRRAEMAQKLSHLKIQAEFFKAEDGHSEQNIKAFKTYLYTPIDPLNAHELEVKLKRKVIYSPGAWGTLKTYDRLIRNAQKRGYKRILSLEDDVLFAKDFESLFIKATKTVPVNWKLLYLGASQHSWSEGIDLLHREGMNDKETCMGSYLPLNTDGAFAIGIDRSVFDHLLSEIGKMNCPFDSGALRSVTKAFKGECFVLKPNLIIADVSDSDIGVGRKQSDFAQIFRWDLALYE